MSTSTHDDGPDRKVISYFAVTGLIVLIGLVLSLLLVIIEPSAPDTTGPACERPASEDTSIAGPIRSEGFIYVEGAPIPDTVYGPDRTTEDTAPTCYEHSPAGASIAAATFASLGANGQNLMLIEELSADTTSRDMALEATPDRTGQGFPTNPAVPVATSIENYTGDRATVTVVMSTDGIYAAGPFTLVWDDGDWKWEIPTGRPHTYTVPHLGGYNEIVKEN